ncbi:hypothetical protein ACH0CM_12600 [Streptomyces albus]|uniref:hypothetical protein n=1 Tax=Streptomyces albus TaxID=1888 RepID=UPI00387920DA
METGNGFVDHLAGVYVASRRAGNSHVVAAIQTKQELDRLHLSDAERVSALRAIEQTEGSER